MSPSLIHSSRAFEITNEPAPTVTVVCHTSKYAAANGLLAHANATTAQTSSRMPPAASARKNACSGPMMGLDEGGEEGAAMSGE